MHSIFYMRKKVLQVNDEMKLGIQVFPKGFLSSEEWMSKFLFDIFNLPQRLVMERLERDGAVIINF